MELTIVVAIVGILAAMGASAYDFAIVRAHISEGFSLVAPMKTAIADNLSYDPAGDACSGIDNIESPVGSVQRTSCRDDGAVARIRVVMTQQAADAVFELVSNRRVDGGSLSWDCISDPAWPGHDYLPTLCRN